MNIQSRIQAHIVASRQEQLLWFLHSCGEQVLTETSGKFFAQKRAFLKQCSDLNDIEPLLQTLVFGANQFPFLSRVIEPFPHAYSWMDVIGSARHEALKLLHANEAASVLWKVLYFTKPYLSTLFGYVPKPFALFFDPKGLGGNLPGLIFQETIEASKKVDMFWSATPVPYFRNKIALEAQKLLSLWTEQNRKKMWVYVHFQSLCHAFEKERGERLLSLASRFSSHFKVLHITLDAPIYLSAPNVCSVDELFEHVVKELQKKNSLYRTSLCPQEKSHWVNHALDVAESAKKWVQEIQGPESSRVFMELFSLGLARRWAGFSLASNPDVEQVFLTQGCKECIDRGAVWLFENALALSTCTPRQLQALLWGRSLLARGRLPEASRSRGCLVLFSSSSKDSIGSWLQAQFEKGLQHHMTSWSLTLLERKD